MIKNVYEILNEFEKVETRQDRINILRANALHHFKLVLMYTYNKKYEFYSEPFPTDYVKPDTFPGIRMAGIDSEIRRVYLWQKGNPTADSLSPQKRHILLLQILESFEPDEAVVWVNMLNKDLKTKGLSESIVKEVFPELFH